MRNETIQRDIEMTIIEHHTVCFFEYVFGG